MYENAAPQHTTLHWAAPGTTFTFVKGDDTTTVYRKLGREGRTGRFQYEAPDGTTHTRLGAAHIIPATR